MQREVTHDNVAIEFLGVWDTVYGSRNTEKLIASKRFNKLRIRSLALDPIVKTGIQILAMDETRRAFYPLFWHRKSEDQFCEQIWMPGVHTDVGGGYRQGLLSEISILSMIAKLSEHCPDLNFDPFFIDEVLMRGISSEEQVVINDEWRGYFGNLFDSHAPREVKSEMPIQSLHPIANWIADKPVNYKGEDAPYKAALKLSSSKSLACTSLNNPLVDWKRVETLVLQKLY
jgi:hypothetical protein